MNNHSPRTSSAAFSRHKTYGLFGGAALGSVFGVLMSGPNFFVWSPLKSLGVIAGCAVGVALIGYFFIGLIVGGFAGDGAWADESGSRSGSDASGVTGDGSGGGD